MRRSNAGARNRFSTARESDQPILIRWCSDKKGLREHSPSSNSQLPSRARVKLAYMRKRLITPTPKTVRSRGEGWLDIERAALVEFTSEDKNYPVESAFVSGEARGWRAAAPGAQTIRVVFDQPQKLKHISLVFEENETTRTQEFVLRWSSNDGNSFQEIVRQQWNFSHPSTKREIEEYQVELSNVTMLELIIVPDINGGDARASLKSLRLS
jgi:hypothetical protein